MLGLIEAKLIAVLNCRHSVCSLEILFNVRAAKMKLRGKGLNINAFLIVCVNIIFDCADCIGFSGGRGDAIGVIVVNNI